MNIKTKGLCLKDRINMRRQAQVQTIKIQVENKTDKQRWQTQNSFSGEETWCLFCRVVQWSGWFKYIYFSHLFLKRKKSGCVREKNNFNTFQLVVYAIINNVMRESFQLRAHCQDTSNSDADQKQSWIHIFFILSLSIFLVHISYFL